MKRLVIVCGLALAGCSFIPQPSSLVPQGLKCPQVPKWQESFKVKLSAEVEKIPQDSALTEAIAELVEVREWISVNCKEK